MDKLVKEILQQVGPGKMSDVAYDTAWLARLGDIDWELSSCAMAWLSEHQLPDGSWGSEKPFYYHDRVISTLAAMIALTYRGRRAQDRLQIERGLLALEWITNGATQGLQSDPNGATVGFEMVVPTLVAEAEKLGIIRRRGESILGKLGEQRRRKLELLKGRTINRHLTAAFSAEMAGLDGQHMLDVEKLQESNGSVGNSPSASAYCAVYIKPGDEAALSYLHQFTNSSGGAPDLIPFDVFEASWVLWNFLLVNEWDNETKKSFVPLVDFLRRGWKSGDGIGLSVEYSIPDGDDTSFVYEILSRFGEQPDINTLLAFEEAEHFRTYHFEADSSSSVNIHALGALRQVGLAFNSPVAQKVILYLRKTKVSNAYWFDKWNLTPYYTTAHAIIACAGFADDLVTSSVDWMLNTQRKDGSWGYQFPTAEETANCLQALMIWKRNGKKVPKAALDKASTWLKDHMEPPYPPLWIGKGLYTPELVVRSTILSALLLYEKG